MCESLVAAPTLLCTQGMRGRTHYSLFWLEPCVTPTPSTFPKDHLGLAFTDPTEGTIGAIMP